MPYPLSGAPYPGGAAAQPSPAYSGTFIPEIWSGKLLEKFYSTTVLAAISNTNYEGEIKNQGDKVYIRTRPTVTINPYLAGQTLAVERPSAPNVVLSIDKGKYFNTILDYVHEVQADMNLMSLWSDDASEQMKVSIDTEILQDLLGRADPLNMGDSAGAKSGTINLGETTAPLNVVARNPTTGQVEVIDLLVRLGQVLDEADIPEQGRWVVLPVWLSATLKMSELRDASLTGDGQSVLRNGRLGMVDRFTIYSSNLTPKGPLTLDRPPTGAGGLDVSLLAEEWAVFAGTTNALTFATQMTKVETLKSESTFGTLLRGLQIYGYGVIDPKSIAQAIVTP